ncbi:MAG: hypothetical protein IPL33_06710 [Sphingobacteriales bacterium]|nr:hypothetical protein [Sphingobacteriales bacterium]
MPRAIGRIIGLHYFARLVDSNAGCRQFGRSLRYGGIGIEVYFFVFTSYTIESVAIYFTCLSMPPDDMGSVAVLSRRNAVMLSGEAVGKLSRGKKMVLWAVLQDAA